MGVVSRPQQSRGSRHGGAAAQRMRTPTTVLAAGASYLSTSADHNLYRPRPAQGSGGSRREGAGGAER